MVIFDPSQFVRQFAPDSLRVHAPTSIIFLCGGAIDAALAVPVVLRDAFFRGIVSTTPDYRIVLAEDAKPLTAEAGYKDLFRFESDIAQVVGLILLFAESAGSLAELGAFAALPNVAPSLLAVLDNFYYDQSSFIKNGPIKHLEVEYGEDWIVVLDRDDLGISQDGSLGSLNISELILSISPAIKSRLDKKPKWKKFELSNSGHAILTMVGLCQDYGALTITEISSYLSIIGFSEVRVPNFLYCAELLGWLIKVRNGNHIYYVATAGEDAITFRWNANSLSKDRTRWRADIRAYWKINEPSRYRAIVKVFSPDVGVL